MVLSFLRGLSSEAELNRIIAKLGKLDTKPASKLAQSRWILSEGILTRLLKTARKALKSKPALLRDVPSPCIVVGDLHGDIHTLIRILKHNGMPPKANYLFLGDYVDRGSNGVEVLALILALHCRYPGHVHCLRGNHESIMMSRAYGFLGECRTRYSTRIYAAAIAVFNVLPVAAIVGGAIFAVHGGITPRLESLADIDAIQRPAKLEPDSLLADLIWGDPIINAGVQDYAASDRGAGHLFGQRAYGTFLERHGFKAMVRAHEVCRRGCRRAFGTCWTVFSHPQYLGLANAAGALVIHADNTFEPQAFAATAEDLDALEGHPLDAEDEETVDAVPRCMESVMLEEADAEERDAVIAELDAAVDGDDVMGLKVGSTSTHGSEQSGTPDGEANISQSGESGLSTPCGPVRTPATSDVQTHNLNSIEALVAALPVGSMLPTSGLPAYGTTVPAIDVDACAMPSGVGSGFAPDGTGEISLSPSPARHRIADAAEAAAADAAAAAVAPAAPATPAAPAELAHAASTAVPIEHRTPSAAPPHDDGAQLSGSPASVAYALAARAGLPTALARPLTAAAGHAFGKVVSPAASAPLAAEPPSPLQDALRSSPPAAAHPMFLSFGAQHGLVSPLQASAGAPAIDPALKASASCSEADAGEHELLLFDAAASAGVCELSRPESPVGGAADGESSPAAARSCSPAQPASPLAGPQQLGPQVAALKVQAAGPGGPGARRIAWDRTASFKSAGRAGSGSVEGSDSVGFGRDACFNASAATLAAVSGLTDEPDALA